MGCHTWFYNTKKPSIKKIKLEFIFPLTYSNFRKLNNDLNMQQYMLEILFNKKIVIDETIDFKYSKETRKFRKKLKSEIKKYKNKYYGSIEELDLRYSNEILNRGHLFNSVKIYRRKQNVIQIEETEFHDVFRTHGSIKYTEEKLYSLSETLNFIEKHKLNISDESLIRLKQFWFKYPDGFIEFG